jgi:uncharacterized protein YbjT (DUF2867 family)
MRRVVMIGATGAVGTVAARALVEDPAVERLTLLGRRASPLSHAKVDQHEVDPLSPAEYERLLAGHDEALCTLGVGQPSKVPRAEFLRVDRDGVLAFARACRAAGVVSFTLLSSVDADARSPSWYLRGKGELEDGLRALAFLHLRLVQPSMILTPTNRFGPVQGVLLAVTPLAAPLLVGPLRKYRGIGVEALGRAMAVAPGPHAEEVWRYDDLIRAAG